MLIQQANSSIKDHLTISKNNMKVFRSFFNKNAVLITLFLWGAEARCFSQIPGVRNGHNMVYFKPSKSIILFGGADEKKVYGDTWSFSHGMWRKITDAGPSPRTFPAMVMADNYILLFGGNAVLFGNDKNPVHYLDDTWKFEDSAWKRIETAPHPDARAEAAISYDPIRKKVVLFGGRMAGEKWIAGDTWEFDGNKWKQINKNGPTPRSGAVMAFDSRLKQVILYGGNPVITTEKDYNGPMWSWDGINWNHIDTSIPLIFNSCMAYNTNDNFMLRFGGWTGKERINDTWVYKDKVWQQLDLKIAPAARNHAVMVYNPNKNSFYLYGGHDGDNVFGDMWIFKKEIWTLLFAEQPLRRIENGH